MLLLRSFKRIQTGRCCSRKGWHLHSLSFRARVCHPNTRICVGLLGPCFKTGRLKPFRQHPKLSCDPFRRASSEPNVINKLSMNGLQMATESPNTELQSSVHPRAWPSTEPRPAYDGFVLQNKLMLTRKLKSALPKRAADFQPTILVPSVSLLTISRTVLLSFQSSFHLSLTVLVRYRSLANI